VADDCILQAVFGQFERGKRQHRPEQGEENGPEAANKQKAQGSTPGLAQDPMPVGSGVFHAVVIFLGGVRAPYKK